MSKKICHITVLHNRYDSRIFWKMCVSISKHYETYLIVADGKGDEVKENVNIIDIGKINSRIKAFVTGNKMLVKKIKEVNADIYHFHDPEIIPVALNFISKGYRFIYDVHEDLPLDIYNKDRITKFLRPFISYGVKSYEGRAVKSMSYTITATDHIRNKLRKYSSKVAAVKNFPDIDRLVSNDNHSEKQKNSLCYLGLLNRSRGLIELLNVLEKVDANLNLGGRFVDAELEKECMAHPAWNKTNYFGYVEQAKSIEIMKQSEIGMMLHHPNKAYSHAIPIKLLEYMACGIPVIVSDYPICEELIGNVGCGFMINAYNTGEITDKVKMLLANKDLAKEMGKKGREAVLEKYNWKVESDLLLSIYSSLLN